MNIFTTAMIILVLIPITGMNIYSLVVLDLSRTSQYHHIECMILTLILTVMLLAEIMSGNIINHYDSFLLKSSYDKTVDQLDRYGYGNDHRKRKISLTALKVLTNKIGTRTDKELGTALAHYRYSELPSPTNEINLVTIEKPGKNKDPRLNKSFPCSPKTAKVALNKFQNRLDEANVSLDEEPNNVRIGVPMRRIEPQTKKKEVRKKFAKRRPKPLNSYQDSDDDSSEEEKSESESISQDIYLARKAVRGAIRAQSSDGESSRSTLKTKNRDNYKSGGIQPQNHIKLTKLKKEIYEKKNE